MPSLICLECGQGLFPWACKRSEMWCDFCRKVTRWGTQKEYHKRLEKKRLPRI